MKKTAGMLSVCTDGIPAVFAWHAWQLTFPAFTEAFGGWIVRIRFLCRRQDYGRLYCDQTSVSALRTEERELLPVLRIHSQAVKAAKIWLTSIPQR